jgi:hypothetical protein
MPSCDDTSNASDLVRRTIRVPGLSDVRIGRQIEDGLAGLPGMSDVRAHVRRKRVCVTYDPVRLGFAQVEQTLEGVGFPPAGGQWSRLKAAWYRWVDDTARANANAPPAACCNNPPNVSTPRRKG